MSLAGRTDRPRLLKIVLFWSIAILTCRHAVAQEDTRPLQNSPTTLGQVTAGVG